MKKGLIIIAQLDFQPVEYSDTRKELEKAGIEISVASLTTEIAVGKDGSQVRPDIAIDDVNSEEYDSLVIIGGPGAPVLGKYEAVLNLIREFNEHNKVIGAICIAPTILALSGILRNKKATVWNKDLLQEKVLEKYEARYVDEEVVVEGNIVTANGPAAAHSFGVRLSELINQTEE